MCLAEDVGRERQEISLVEPCGAGRLGKAVGRVPVRTLATTQ